MDDLKKANVLVRLNRFVDSSNSNMNRSDCLPAACCVMSTAGKALQELMQIGSE